MSTTAAPSPLLLGERELGPDGIFRRRTSAFREWVGAPDGPPAAAGRYHLYVSWACPWAHRTVIVRQLKGLTETVSLSAVDPIRDERGWAFTGGEYTDPLNGFSFIRQGYERTRPGYDDRSSVPVLWDKQDKRIVSNESADIIRMLNGAFDEWSSGPDLCPEALRPRIDELNEHIYATVNNAVYAAGMTTDQGTHEEKVRGIFSTFDELEQRLERSRYLLGDEPTEADWRLFTTLVRFDAVYYVHFKCNLRRLVDHPNLWAYTRDLYQLPAIAETVRMDEIKRHYYMTHPRINPSRLVPIGPELDFEEPHGRG